MKWRNEMTKMNRVPRNDVLSEVLFFLNKSSYFIIVLCTFFISFLSCFNPVDFVVERILLLFLIFFRSAINESIWSLMLKELLEYTTSAPQVSYQYLYIYKLLYFFVEFTVLFSSFLCPGGNLTFPNCLICVSCLVVLLAGLPSAVFRARLS